MGNPDKDIRDFQPCRGLIGFDRIIMKKLALAVSLLAISAVGASAADMAPAPVYSKAPVVMPPVYDWTGFYVGANAGGAWSNFDPATSTVFSPVGYFAATSVTAIGAAGLQGINNTGFTGGLTAGYNWQAGAAVVGIESDFNYFGVKGSTSSSAIYPCCAPTSFTINTSTSSDWLFTLRGRAGFLVTPALLLYGTGGLAVADVKAAFNFTDTFASATESAAISTTRAGWTAGAGAEYALMNGWSIKAEYLYVDLGQATATSTNLNTTIGAYPASVFTHTVNLTSNIGRVGINYKFGGPVVARY
jgi:outer membrane immunogenic protein